MGGTGLGGRGLEKGRGEARAFSAGCKAHGRVGLSLGEMTQDGKGGIAHLQE